MIDKLELANFYYLVGKITGVANYRDDTELKDLAVEMALELDRLQDIGTSKKVCGNCHDVFTDTDNRLSIAKTGDCLGCDHVRGDHD